MSRLPAVLLVLLPILLLMYVRLARREERDAAAQFWGPYERYAKRVPAFIPSWSRRHSADAATGSSPGSEEARMHR